MTKPILITLLALLAGTSIPGSAGGSRSHPRPVTRSLTTIHALRSVSGSLPAFDTTATIADPAWFERMYQRGFRLYVMHSTSWGTCAPWPNTQSQLAAALAAGLKIAVYTRDPRCWQGGIQATGQYASQLQFFALDIETDPGIAVTRQMVDGVQAMGVRPVIYSGASMWPQIMRGAAADFADVPLWDSNVTGRLDPSSWTADLQSPAPIAYGGWNTPANPRVLMQHAFNAVYDGVTVDLDSVSASFLR